MNRVYAYPPALRVLGLFGSMLAGGILLGSVVAEIEAADPFDFVLHLLGAIAGAAIVWLGLEFGARRIAVSANGISTRLLRERAMAWTDVRVACGGLFGALTLVPKRGAPIVIWPFMDDFNVLVDALSETTHA